MAIDFYKHDEEMDMICNHCGVQESEHGTWQECIALHKANGWWITKNEGTDEWEHYCCRRCFKEGTGR